MEQQQLSNVDRITPAPGTLRAKLQNANIKQRFIEILRDRAPAFISSLSAVVYSSRGLSECDPDSVIAAALQAAAFDLPIDPNLSFAHIVPFKDHGVKKAQFQLGWRGYVQLAQRSNQYLNIAVNCVYDGEIEKFDRFTDAITWGERKSNTVVGYLAYFKLLSGFEKYVYMTTDDARAWGERYSKTYYRDDSKWKTALDDMGKKTVIKQALSKWGPLSIEMQRAISMENSAHESEDVPLPDEHSASSATIEAPALADGKEYLYGSDEEGDKAH